MKVTLLGFTMPNELYSEIADSDKVLPAQTHRFAWSIVDALQSANAAEVRLISVAPVSNYPNNPRVLWRGGRWRTRQVPGLSLPFINLPILKHLTRFASCWLLASRELRRHQPDWLLVHGVHSPFLWFAALYGGRSSTHAAAILTDPPGLVRPSDSLVTAWLKRVDIFIVRSALKRFDAVISLTEALATDFAPSAQAMVMEGITADACKTALTELAAAPPSSSRPRVIYAGGIQREYGVLTLIEAVVNSELDVELRIFGKGIDADLVRQASEKDARIVGPNVLHPEELAIWYRSAVALVQPRPVDQPFVPYSFPSKLIEYLGTGTPVVSTRLPSIPGDYESQVVWAIPDSPEGIRDALARVLTWDEAKRRAFGAGAAQFIHSTRSPQAQGKRIMRFLQECQVATHNDRR